jgi:hypothetical protein
LPGSYFPFEIPFPAPRWIPATPEKLRHLYAQQKAHPGYKQLRESTLILGTWDDHDFGVNDADSTFPIREASQTAFLDFLDEPKDRTLTLPEKISPRFGVTTST